MLFSRAILRTSGEVLMAWVLTSGTFIPDVFRAETETSGLSGACCIRNSPPVSSFGFFSSTGFSGGFSVWASGVKSVGSNAVPFSPVSLMIARTASTLTVWPSGTRISPSIPDAGDGISESTLSVEISNKGSSLATVSPAFFSHFVRVPS